MYFRVPTFRADLLREIDLIEEAARMIGYEKGNESAVGSVAARDSFSNNPLDLALKKISRSLVARGFSEAMNYAFLSKELHAYFLDSQDSGKTALRQKNPLSERYAVMRRSLVPGLVKNLLHNQRNQEKSVMLFEAGTVFLGKRENDGIPKPDLLLGSLDQTALVMKNLFYQA